MTSSGSVYECILFVLTCQWTLKNDWKHFMPLRFLAQCSQVWFVFIETAFSELSQEHNFAWPCLKCSQFFWKLPATSVSDTVTSYWLQQDLRAEQVRVNLLNEPKVSQCNVRFLHHQKLRFYISSVISNHQQHKNAPYHFNFSLTILHHEQCSQFAFSDSCQNL